MNPIVGIGELLWDVYDDGRKVAGGAPFNFAFHCHNLGHPAAIVSRVGDDDLGRELRERVRELGLSDEFIQTDHDHPTGTVQVELDANKVPTYTIVEDVAWDHITWNDALAALARRFDAVCFGTLSRRTLRQPIDDVVWKFLLERSAAAGPDPDFDPLARWSPKTHKESDHPLVVADLNYRPPHINSDAVTRALVDAKWHKMSREDMLHDWPKLFPIEGREEFTPRNWYERCWWEGGPPDKVLIATDGPNGVTVLHLDDEFHIPGVPTTVADTVGAGDAFTAAMVCLFLEGRSLRDAATFAVHYAARVCEHQGATPTIDRAGVERAAGLS